ncbi:hypothetical protein INS49_010909 [Diaporthe citri]|uniref:uncharacterized protein n=1 Tax=Diaporthe citri TaxID=83186 RepID=UPI001C819A1E|nr:uncharacterized protein INS49_010909 [Diaporthe citri]KAG6359856.1 hypothetical protein INS49_010909 [Diaporthe citri]
MSDSTAWKGAVPSAEYMVYHGIWTNWSRGPVMGATLTLSRADGNYLLAFTAFFISMVSARFWRILCFIAHNKFSTPEPRDAVHHQRQAILRNSASAPSGLWIILQLIWTWRRVADRLLARAMPVILTAVICAAAFTVAGGFSSQLSTGISKEVLLDGSRCGIINAGDDAPGNAVLFHDSNGLSNAANYAQQCYSVNISRAFDCTTFVQPTLPSIIDRNAPCPFDRGICRSNTSNIHLDTGHIDSSQFLGINAPRSERVLFRSTLTCAPLVTENYSDNITLPSGNFTRYYYGPQQIFKYQDFTYQAPGLNSQYPRISDHTKSRGKNLQVAVIQAKPLNGAIVDTSDFNPISELFRDDGDLTIAFLVGNGVWYSEKTTDPWYRGTVPSETWRWLSPNSTDEVAYTPDEAASPLGCLQQFQICNVDENHCGPLKGFYDYQFHSASVFNISEEAIENDELFVENNPLGQRFQWFTGVMAYGGSIDIFRALSQLGAYSLSSQSSMRQGYMGLLAENQWQLDVERWWSIGLASMQAGMVDVAVGPTEAALQPYTIHPPSSYIQDSFCNSQKILTTRSTSFSLFGIYFTYVVGTIIVIVSYSLEPVQNFLYRRKKIAEYARLEWATTESLQLQRVAYQGIGSGTWAGHFDAVPMTESDELMGDLPHSYHTGSGSSCTGHAKLSAEKLDPAPISPPSTGETSEESNESAVEDNRHFMSSAEQEIVPVVSRHATG